MTVKETSDADRVLVAVYRLAKGSTETVVSHAEIDAEIRREKLFELSESDFEAYGKRAYAEVVAHRAAQAPSKPGGSP